MSTPTPRTDKMSESLLSKTFLTSYVTMQELARTLERELATERAKYNQLLSALVYADQILDDIDTCSDAHKPMYSSYSQNVFKLCIKGRDARRAFIDAAMKEGAK